jgi:hypothetical protein
MAYAFTAASNQYFNTASTPVTTYPLTLSCWFNPTSGSGVAETVCGLFANEANGAGILVTIRKVSGNPRLGFGTYIAGNFSEAQSGNLSTATWYHGAGVIESSTSKYVYVNGVRTQNTTTMGTPSTLNSVSIGAVNRPTPEELLNSSCAEIGLWNVALSQAEITSLAKGMPCYLVRPQSLKFYAPIIRDVNDVRGGLAITNNNSPSVTAHPRIYK